MIYSMTGFGRGESSSDGISVTAEVKSLNSRYCDITVNLPHILQDYEFDLKEKIKSFIDRGKIYATVHLDMKETGEPDITFNRKLVKGYQQLLKDLKETAEINEPVTLSHLLNFENIFTQKEEDEETIEKAWNLSAEATEKAVEQMIKMRKQEGSQLEKDLRQRIKHIGNIMESIKEKAKEQVPEVRDRLHKRINDLIDDDSIDEERLEMEVAIQADKIDVTEEIVRVQSHIKFFLEALSEEESMGRRLYFLSQELNREINTIGSKADHSEISQEIVQAKETLEKIKEQIQNIE